MYRFRAFSQFAEARKVLLPWKRMVTATAVRHGIIAQFTDLVMQTAVDQHPREADPLQLQAERLHSIEARLITEEAADLVFTEEADVRQLLVALQSVPQARHLVELLKTSRIPEPKQDVDGILTVALFRSPNCSPIQFLRHRQ